METINKRIKVKISPNSKQEDQFKKNFGSSRKVYNHILAEYNSLYGQNNHVTPSMTLLGDLFNEAKKELPYLNEVEPTSLQEALLDLHSDLNDYLNDSSKDYPTFRTKKKTKLYFRQMPNDKQVIRNDELCLRDYGIVKFQTSNEYLRILNSKETKFNNITVTSDGLDYYAIINIETTGDELKKNGLL